VAEQLLSIVLNCLCKFLSACGENFSVSFQNMISLIVSCLWCFCLEIICWLSSLTWQLDCFLSLMLLSWNQLLAQLTYMAS